MYGERIKRIHFIGIGGSGMNGIAEVLVNMGYQVTGSDLFESDVTRRLRNLGAEVYIGHCGENVDESDCVVYSSAVKRENPELKEAASRQIPAIPRAEMLAELMRMKYGIAVAGTHGKTTTTSMISVMLAEAGLDPTIVNGGKLNSMGSNARLGQGEFLVAEADESDGSFLKLTPTIAVVTNIDREHMDHYRDMDEVKHAYVDFINKVPFYGCAVLCLDHPVIQGLIPEVTRRFLSYGLSAQADLHATKISYNEMKTSFQVVLGSDKLGTAEINMPGEHNVYNALAAISVALELGIEFDVIKKALKGFTGVERRFHVRGVAKEITVVDDYGHHPEEIKAVLKAAKEGWGKRVVVVFQPHRYTRTMDLFSDFLSAFNDAEKVILTDVYTAGEDGEKTIAERLYKGIKEHGHKDVSYEPDLAKVPALLEKSTEAGDMVITLGAGDVWKAGVGLLQVLRSGEKGLSVTV